MPRYIVTSTLDGHSVALRQPWIGRGMWLRDISSGTKFTSQKRAAMALVQMAAYTPLTLDRAEIRPVSC